MCCAQVKLRGGKEKIFCRAKDREAGEGIHALNRSRQKLDLSRTNGMLSSSV
jgi:hypothetical protein